MFSDVFEGYRKRPVARNESRRQVNVSLKYFLLPGLWKCIMHVFTVTRCSVRDCGSTTLILLFSVVRKCFEKLICYELVEKPEEYDLPDFQDGFSASYHTASFATVMTDQVVDAFKVLGSTRAASLNISKIFDRVRQNIVFQKLKLGI